MLSLIYVFFYRPNNDRILAAKRRRLFVQIGDIVTITDVASKKLQSKHVHTILNVRSDLEWKDVVNNFTSLR